MTIFLAQYISWIPAAMTTTALAMAPIASALCQRLNCRWVSLMGRWGTSPGHLATQSPDHLVTWSPGHLGKPSLSLCRKKTVGVGGRRKPHKRKFILKSRKLAA